MNRDTSLVTSKNVNLFNFFFLNLCWSKTALVSVAIYNDEFNVKKKLTIKNQSLEMIIEWASILVSVQSLRIQLGRLFSRSVEEKTENVREKTYSKMEPITLSNSYVRPADWHLFGLVAD